MGGGAKTREEGKIPNRPHDQAGATKDRRALDDGDNTLRMKEASPCQPSLFISNMESL